jgi:hypothetical protein
MSLTSQEIQALINEHKSELSALNALIKLLQGGGSSLILENNSNLNRTPNLLRTSAAGSIPVACYDFSVFNAGLADGVLLGQPIRPGESLNFSAGSLNNIYPAGTVTYDGTGTELVIIYNS